jgi:iron-sulfur cluster repair protein YtfE (RIC family)
MDVYALLTADHEKAKALFTALEATKEADVKKRESLFSELNLELSVHMAAEEKFLYPETLAEAPIHAKTQEAYEEHNVAKALLKQLEAEDKGTEAWTAKLTVLRENIEHHVREEENDLFIKARKRLSQKQAVDIADEILEYKESFDLATSEEE